MVMRVVMESLVVELERVVGVDLFFFGSGFIRGRRLLHVPCSYCSLHSYVCIHPSKNCLDVLF
jgi:hypothetical protein